MIARDPALRDRVIGEELVGCQESAPRSETIRVAPALLPVLASSKKGAAA